jgi:hypothetical protein
VIAANSPLKPDIIRIGPGDVGRTVACYTKSGLCYGVVSAFHPASDHPPSWSVLYRNGVREEVNASELMERLRLAVVLAALETEKRAFVCPDCGLGLQTANGYR